MTLRRITTWCILLLSIASCTNDSLDDGNTDLESLNSDEVYISIHHQLQDESHKNLNFISSKIDLWEETVHSLRIIAFNSFDNSYCLNRLLTLDTGSDGSILSEAFPIQSGVLDFYFIANEESLGDDFVNRLKQVQVKGDWEIMAKDGVILPLLSSEVEESKGLLMYATYPKITVPKASEGNPIYDENNPWNFKGDNEYITLSKAMAKVELIVRKDFEEESYKTIESVTLNSFPNRMNTPSKGAFYLETNIHKLISKTIPKEELHFDYTKKDIGMLSFYVPEYLVDQNNILYSHTALVIKVKEGNSVRDVEVPLLTNYTDTQGNVVDNISEFVTIDGIDKGYKDNQNAYYNNSLFRSLIYRTIANLNADFELTFQVASWIPENYYQEFNPIDPNSEFKVKYFDWSDSDMMLTTKGSVIELSFEVDAQAKDTWRIELTNGADFSLTSDSPHSGVVAGKHNIKIEALRDPSSQFRHTYVKFYVNDREIPPSQIYDEDGEQLYPNLNAFRIRQTSKIMKQ